MKRMTNSKKNKYHDLVNFSKNKDIPRHRWFDIKEGYSLNLVSEVISDLNVSKKSIIFDPFSGSGTTVLGAKQNNIDSVGFEVNPFLHSLSTAKILNINSDLEELLIKFKNLKKKKEAKAPKLKILKKLFGNQLKIILQMKGFINELPESNQKKIFKTIFLSSLEDCSFARKDGNGLKYPKNRKPKKFLRHFEEKISLANLDLKKKLPNRNSKIYLGNSIDLIKSKRFKEKYKEKIDLCLFSPPYANCFDYTEVYKVELWMGDFVREYSDLKALREKSLSSHLNKNFEGLASPEELKPYLKKIDINKLWSKKIYSMLISYFYEMNILLMEIYKVLAKSGHCVIVIGNSAYSNKVIPSDIIFSNMAKNIGFSESKIVEARKLGTSSQQLNKVDKPSLLRESLVFLKK